MVQTRPKTRLHEDQDLYAGAQLTFSRTQAAYLTKVLCLKSGTEVGLFNSRDGEWRGRLMVQYPRYVVGQVEAQLCAPEAADGATLAFAPIKRTPLEWLLIKATEPGAGTAACSCLRRSSHWRSGSSSSTGFCWPSNPS